MLKQRILTALVLASVVLGALYGLPDNLLLMLFALLYWAGHGSGRHCPNYTTRRVEFYS